MHDLTAQVTSSLLPFSKVTIDALGEDEITLDSVLHGNFTVGRSGLAWLACGPHLEVVHAVTGERLSAYCFSGGGEHPPCVLAARDFSWLKRSGLLVGLEETEGSVLCLYDLALSRVVKAVVIPGRITGIEPLVSYGGASTSTQHLHQSLRWFFGIAAVMTDLGHVLLVDLCLDDLSCSQSEVEASDLQVVTKSPAEIPRLREVSTREGRHLCLQLNGPSGVGATALQYISRTNQLAVGFSDGHLQLWNMKTLKKEYHSQLEGGRVPVHSFTFQEPENDPRNCCYLWAVQSSQDLEGDIVSLHLLQLAFSERKCLASGKILYEGLEYCEERYSQDLNGTAFPLRAKATKTRLLSCQTIEKFRPHPDRDDSMNEVASPDTSVSIFSWQIKAYGQGSPSTYIGVFDINRWYHAQMPDSLRMGESLQNCPYLAVWSLDPVVQMVSPHILLDVVVHDRSLSRGLPFTCPPPEQYFNPTTYNFDATCLVNSGIVHLTCSGYQKETLGFLKKAAPCSSDIISTSFSHCLMSGLLSSRLADTQASSLSQEEQLDAILSTAVETSSLGLITGCIKQWTAEEQPGSALNLRYILDWAWNKVVQTKDELDGICAPLFDGSSNFTDPQTLQLLQHSQRLLGNLSAIFHCLLSEAQELTQKGLTGLMNKNMVSSLISKYAQVVLWFCRTGLLPEGLDEDALQISRPFYTHGVISNYYTIRREELTRLAKGKWCADCLMIDGLVAQCGERLTNLWKRDEGGTGQYPPPTLHALLDIYLLDSVDEASKHAIVIYLLLDVMYSFPNKDGASVESFPTAFAIPIGLVKLVQGLWLLDHHDHQSSFELLLHPAASQCHFEWQHERVLQALMCQGQQSVALRYFHVAKPSISTTSQAKLCLSVLLHNRCLIEALCLLRQHSSTLNMGELLSFLYESCQELGLIKELLKLPLGFNEQECLEKFLQGTGGLQNRELLMVHYLQQANYIPAFQLNHSLKMNLVNERDPKLKERSNIRNSILDQYGKVLPRVQRKLAMERAKPYQHPHTIHREVSRPQPLSTITKRSANEKVMSRAGLINNVLTKIKEVWLGNGSTPQSSPSKSPRSDVQSPSPKTSSGAFPDPFLGTPITMTSKRKSRLMDLVVHPSCQSPRPSLIPTRPPSSRVSPKSVCKASELSLLQTPQVVKRARALAASGPVFSGFTPQSILRSSLRPTPVATPSVSPGRSITPPLRSKESRITFIEEAESPETEKGIRWTNGMAADSEISLLTRGSSLSKATHKTWSSGSQAAEEEEQIADEEVEQPRVKFLPPEGGLTSPQLKSFESASESSIQDVAAETKPSDATQISLNLDTSQAPIPSTDTTLEYYDAPLLEDQEAEEGHGATEKDDDVITLNIKVQPETEGTNEKPLTTTEQFIQLTSDDTEKEEEKMEDEIFEDVMEISFEPQDKNEEVQSEKEEDIESSTKQEDVTAFNQEEISSHDDDGNQVSSDVGTEVSQNPPVMDEGQDIQSEVTESHEPTEHLKPSTITESTSILDPADELEQATDLTEFVQRHLFGADLSPPLTRSAIHNASQTQTNVNSEPLDEDEEDVAASSVFTTQKSTTSVTSSEPTGTDSHSVVSINDSEDLSSPASEEEEEDEEEDESDQAEEEEGEEEVEEEDSGSEVEIIEEVQGNGRLPPLQPSSVFVQEDLTHFMPTLSEQEVSDFSLITPVDAEMKMEEEVMEGEVVMVRLGASEGVMDPDLEQGSSYMELRPSTTLLVPMELMEGQHSLADAELDLPDLQPTISSDDPHTETHFSLTLDMDEDGNKEAALLPVDNDLQSSTDPSTLSQVVDAMDECLVRPELILLGADDQDTIQPGEPLQKEIFHENDVDGLKESEAVELPADMEAESTETKQEAEKTEELKEVELETLTEDQDSATVSEAGPHPVEDLPAAVDDKDPVVTTEAPDEEMVEENEIAAAEKHEEPEEQKTPATEEPEEKETPATEEPEDKETPAAEEPEEKETPAAEEPEENETTAAEKHEEMEENGPVDININVALSTEVEPVIEEQHQDPDPSADSQTDNKDTRTEKETKKKGRGRPKKDATVQEDNSQTEEQRAVSDTPSSKRKKAPPTPTRRTTRRTVTIVSPLPEQAENPEEGNLEDAETSTVVPASPSRTPRKGKQVKETMVSTPRRSTRKVQLDPQTDDVDTMETSLAPTTRAASSSPARRSQRASATKTSQRTRSSSEETSAPTEAEAQEEEVTGRTRSKTPTPAKTRTTEPSTPRRSRRKILTSEAEPLEILQEEKEQDDVPSVKRSVRRTRTVQSDTLLDEEDKKPPSSPGRTTRQSQRVTLQVKPQSLRKMRGEMIPENTNHEDLLKPELNKNSPRTDFHHTNWDHPEEDFPLLDSPLEVDSDTPIADALIKRLQDEEEKQEGGVVIAKTVRTSRRRIKSSVDQVESLPSVKDGLPPEPEDDESSPGEHTFIYSPSRRRTRAHKAKSPGPSEEPGAPVTRSRRVKGVAPQDEMVSEEDHMEVEKTDDSTRKKTGKRTAKSKAVLEPLPVVEPELISPLPSPAEALPRVLKRTEGEAPTTSRNLRRKRVIDTVFRKPVTRRKKL